MNLHMFSVWIVIVIWIINFQQTDEFLKELQKIAYMLLCHDVNKCPYAEELLNVERRREIARDVNELILDNAPRNQGRN